MLPLGRDQDIPRLTPGNREGASRANSDDPQGKWSLLAAVGPAPLERLYGLIGESMQAYAMVEAHQATLFELLLRTDRRRANAIFFAIQNVRARNELLETLLELEFGSGLERYWASCSGFLSKLAQFRNAIAHWHPYVNIYAKDDSSDSRSIPALGDPVLGRNARSLEATDFPAFIRDCMRIREELSSLNTLVRERPSTLPEKFQKPIAHRNAAVLPRRKAKGQEPRHSPPSAQPKGKKPSAKQRRDRALSSMAKKT
jgi:hypothetical protein